MIIFDIRYHPRHWQLGFSANTTTTQDPGIYQTRSSILMIHLILITIDMEHHITWLKDNPP